MDAEENEERNEYDGKIYKQAPIKGVPSHSRKPRNEGQRTRRCNGI